MQPLPTKKTIPKQKAIREVSYKTRLPYCGNHSANADILKQIVNVKVTSASPLSIEGELN